MILNSMLWFTQSKALLRSNSKALTEWPWPSDDWHRCNINARAWAVVQPPRQANCKASKVGDKLSENHLHTKLSNTLATTGKNATGHKSDSMQHGGEFFGTETCAAFHTAGKTHCFREAHSLPSVLWRCWLGVRKGIRPVKTEWWDVGMFVWDEVQTCI